MKSADKKEAEKNLTMMYATFDLQAVLVLPYVQDGQVYYSRKIGLYNFTIYDSSKEVVCNVFDEGNGAKSSTEIASCLFAYLESLPAEIRHVVFYCDTASGQNRNQYVLATLRYAVHHVGNIHTIDLKFLESGHSFMECDSVHSRIEKTRKKLRLFTPNDYENVMRAARTKPKPYEIKRWHYSDFYTIRKLTREIIVNSKIDSNEQPVNWLKVKWFRLCRNSMVVSFKYDDVQGDFSQFDVRKTIRRTRKNPPPPLLPMNQIKMEKGYYCEPLPISIPKKRDLLSLITKGIIPKDFSSYYNSFSTFLAQRVVALFSFPLKNQPATSRSNHKISSNKERGRCLLCYRRVADVKNRKEAMKLSFIHTFCPNCPENFLCFDCFNGRHILRTR